MKYSLKKAYLMNSVHEWIDLQSWLKNDIAVHPAAFGNVTFGMCSEADSN